MCDSFDHWESGKPGDERSSLPGEDTEIGGEGLGNGEEEEESQARLSWDDSVLSEMASSERLLPTNGSPMLSTYTQESATGHAPVLIGEAQIETNDWQCDYPSCGRQFQKRHDLKQVPLFHCILTSKHTLSRTERNILHQILIF